MSWRRERSLAVDQAVGMVSSRRRKPPPPPAAAEAVRPASITRLSIKPTRPWTLLANFHPTYAIAAIYIVVGQVLIGTLNMPTIFRIPLPVGDWAIPVPWALLYIPFLALAGLLFTFGETYHGGAKAYFFFAGLSLGTWMALAQIRRDADVGEPAFFHGIYSPPVFWALAACWVVFSALYAPMRHAQQRFEDAWWALHHPIRAAAEASAAQVVIPGEPTEEDRWNLAFGRVFGFYKVKTVDPKTGQVTADRHSKIKFVERVEYPETGNLTIVVRMVDDTLTFKQFSSEQTIERLERLLGLSAGAIRVEKIRGPDGRESSSEIFIHLDIVDVLARNLAYVDDDTPVSCRDAFEVGKFADGTPIMLTLAEIHAMIIGATGAGKTNVLHILVARLSRCYDAVIIALDMKGGAFLRPWLQPWVDGKTSRPIFYWVAVELAEAYRILQGLLALAKRRGRMVGKAPHGSKWRPTRKEPALFVFVDELSELAGQHAYQKAEEPGGPTTSKAAKLLTRLVILCRGLGIWFILGTQRNTVDMSGSGTTNTQIRLRIGMQVTNSTDASKIFGHSNSLASRQLSRLRHDGSVLVQKGQMGSRIMPGKWEFFGDDDDIIANAERVCLARDRNPEMEGPAQELDPPSLAALAPYMGPDDSRWMDMDRIGWLIDPDYDIPDDDEDDEDLLTPPGGARPAAPRAKGGLGEAFRQRRAERERAAAERRGTEPNPAFDRLAEELAADPAFADAWDDVLNADHAAGPVGGDIEKGSTTAADDATRDASEAGTIARGKRVVVDLCRAAGHAGVSATDIRNALIAEGVVTKGGTTAYSRIVKAAMADGEVHQPGGARQRYYLTGFGTGRTE